MQTFKPLFSAIAIVCLSSVMQTAAIHAAPADRFAGVEMKATHISGSVHMLEGAGGNIGVSVGEDGTLIIDDQFAPLADKIANALNQLGGDRPKLVLNTHYHSDHTGSNNVFGTSGTIIAHDNVRIRLLTQDHITRTGLPLVTYAESVNIHFNDDELEMIHMPAGHTDGDSVVWFKKANVIHMGDLFFNGRFPYIDVASGGTVDGFIANVEGVIGMLPADIKIIPGHGPLATLEDLKANIEVARKTSTKIREALNKQQDVTDIAAQIELDYPNWGSGFISAERWVQIIQADANNT